MEDLIKIKEAEVAQLTQVKDALRKQVKKFRDEINSLNEKIEKLENEPKNPLYPDLSDELKDQEEKNKKLLEEIESLKKEPLSPEKLMEQLKKGMFSLGQQNASIESKIDNFLEQVEKGNQGKPKVEFEKKEIISNHPQKSFVSEPEKTISRKPSDILKKKPVEEIPQKKIPTKVVPGTIKSISYPEDGVLKCPHCGEQSFQEQQNKKKIISYAPIKKYAKKYYCKNCRQEWDYN